ncbi:MAG: hypothetical protein Q8P58_00570 [Candidatus Adlerbacteria bacterium]|nr:hypothetical protein [Candidatus Adlerbacteria bacterium]
MKPNDLGKTFLVEECRKISMREYLARARGKLKETLLSSEVNVFDTPIGFTTSRTGFGGTRHWFACPACGQRVGVLFMHPISHQIGCRTCLRLEYRARRYKGMIEAEAMR